tara:strand:- start:257 stop:472 length:216 start_codon:yes stop_codon:yes gene_type:complete
VRAIIYSTYTYYKFSSILDCVKNEDENIFIKENIISIHIEILLKQKLFIFINIYHSSDEKWILTKVDGMPI